MSRVLVAGLINVETTLRVDGFPVEYTPVRYPFFGVDTESSGVGTNIAKALTLLGHDVRFLSLIGDDVMGTLVRSALRKDGIDDSRVISKLRKTPQSVILYDSDGRRQINVDLKDIQSASYPPDLFEEAAEGCDLLVLCNINFSRPLLSRAQEWGMKVATDVHVVSDLDDEYNRDFMAAADILFMSDEGLPCSSELWIEKVRTAFDPDIAVVGLGSKGALLWSRAGEFVHHQPSVQVRPIVSSIGAGDALFSAFVHGYLGGKDPRRALEDATVFASYKIGEAGAAQGFLDAESLEEWCDRLR